MLTLPKFVEAFHRHRLRDPNACIALGVDLHLDELPDPSEAGESANLAEAQALLTAARSIDTAPLNFDDRLDLELAMLLLESEIHGQTYTFNGRTRHQQAPRAGDDVGNGIFMLFINDPRPAAARLSDICGRLERVPAYVEARLASIDTPVARWVDMDRDKVEGLPSMFATITAWAEAEKLPELDRLRAARESAEAALRHYSDALGKFETTQALHLDRATAQRLVALRGIPLSLDELHAMARDYLRDTSAIIAELRTELVAKYELDPATTTEALHTFLAGRFRVRAEAGDMNAVLTRYQAERERILTFIAERELFPIPGDQDMLILRTPQFLAPTIPAGAMVPPPPFREGIRKSVVYLTLSPELIDEHTELSIPSMMIHEGIPGHHLQLATASKHPSVIRRHVDCADLSEGWTTMLEDYMLDIGYMGDLTAEARFCGKRDICRIGARVAIDLFFMTGDKGFLEVGVECDLTSDDPFVAAGNLLRAVTGFVPERVEAELNWYSQERGYPLSYLTGNRLVWQLKADTLAKRVGTTAEAIAIDRDFHALYLTSGNMPLSFLRRVFQHRGMID